MACVLNHLSMLFHLVTWQCIFTNYQNWRSLLKNLYVCKLYLSLCFPLIFKLWGSIQIFPVLSMQTAYRVNQIIEICPYDRVSKNFQPVYNCILENRKYTFMCIIFIIFVFCMHFQIVIYLCLGKVFYASDTNIIGSKKTVRNYRS